MTNAKKPKRKDNNAECQSSQQQLGTLAIKSHSAVTSEELTNIDLDHDEAPVEATEATDTTEEPLEEPVATSETTETSEDAPVSTHEYHVATENTASKPQKRWFTRPVPLVLLSLGLLLVGGISWLTYTYTNQGSLSSFAAGSVPIAKNSSRDTITANLKKIVESYRFSINDGQHTVTYSAADAGLGLDAKKTIDDVLASQRQSLLLDKLAWWKTSTSPIALSIDESKFATFISDHIVKTTIEPKNATLATDTGEIITTAETAGEGITVKNPRDTLLSAVSHITPHYTMTLTKQTIPAHVKAGDLQPLIDEITAVSKTPVTVTLGEESVAATPSTIIAWVDPVQEGDIKARFEINSGKVAAWINNLADKHTTPTQNEVHATNPDGSERILTTGHNGTEVGANAQIAKDIVASLETKQPVNKTLSITSKPFKVINVTAYDKWLLADLSNHMLYAYERDQQVNAFPMSAGAPDTPTVVGEFKIYSKVRSQTMRGPNTDGTSYNVPNVEWVNYFYKDYAIHGNYWRPLSVFGSLNTSHGCIGMPNSSSQWVYEWAPIGTPVITYY